MALKGGISVTGFVCLSSVTLEKGRIAFYVCQSQDKLNDR